MKQRLKMKVSEYRRRCFAPASAPDARTVIARIRRGDIVGTREGRLWYVYPDEKPAAEQRLARLIAEFDREAVA